MTFKREQTNPMLPDFNNEEARKPTPRQWHLLLFHFSILDNTSTQNPLTDAIRWCHNDFPLLCSCSPRSWRMLFTFSHKLELFLRLSWVSLVAVGRKSLPRLRIGALFIVFCCEIELWLSYLHWNCTVTTPQSTLSRLPLASPRLEVFPWSSANSHPWTHRTKWEMAPWDLPMKWIRYAEYVYVCIKARVASQTELQFFTGQLGVLFQIGQIHCPLAHDGSQNLGFA